MLLIILENTNFNAALADPNLKAFADSGVLFNNWRAFSHPSQPNYIAMTSGSGNGVFSDFTTTIDVQNVADLLEAKGLTWKSYQENWPGNCFTGTSSGTYYRSVIPSPFVVDVPIDPADSRKHNPFISYANIQTNSTRCANIVDASQLATDIAAGMLPTFALYTVTHDG
jgi:acid phosphatase